MMVRQDSELHYQDRVSTLNAESWPRFDDICGWFKSALGQHVIETEAAMLDQLLPGIFGYHLVQVSVQDRQLFAASAIQNKFSLALEQSSNSGLVGIPDSLPFANDSVDVMLLHHLLDFTDSTNDVLREMSRVTMPMGYVVIVGFNPLSLWGLWGGVARYRGRAPWNGRFLSTGRLMDNLNLLNFKIDRAQYAVYGPPVARWSGRVNDYSLGVSRRLNLPVGSVYVIVAQKQVGSLRPVRPVWRNQPSFGGLTVVRSVKHDG